MLDFSVQFDAAGLIKELNIIADDIQNPADALRDTSSQLDWIVDQTFRNEGRGAHRWAPLAPITIENKGKGKKILVDKANLKGSFSGNIQGNILEYGSSADYAAKHQEGTKFMPARPPIILTDSDVNDILEFFIPKSLEKST